MSVEATAVEPQGFLILRSERSSRLEGRENRSYQIGLRPRASRRASISGVPEIAIKMRKSGKPDLRSLLSMRVRKTILHPTPL